LRLGGWGSCGRLGRIAIRPYGWGLYGRLVIILLGKSFFVMFATQDSFTIMLIGNEV